MEKPPLGYVEHCPDQEHCPDECIMYVCMYVYVLCMYMYVYVYMYVCMYKELVIMLPLHGQNTAALQLKDSGQAILQNLTKKDVFVKQVDMKNLPNSSKEINIQT